MAETSETDYNFTLRNIPEDRIYEIMNSHNTKILHHTLCWSCKMWRLCCWVSSYRCLEGSYCLHLQGSRFFLDSLRLKMSALRSAKTSGTTHPPTRCHIPEDLNPLKYRYENLKSRKHYLIIVINSFLSSTWFYHLCQYIPYWIPNLSSLPIHPLPSSRCIIAASTPLTKFPIYHCYQYIDY